jgi:hypothetical protein
MGNARGLSTVPDEDCRRFSPFGCVEKQVPSRRLGSIRVSLQHGIQVAMILVV